MLKIETEVYLRNGEPIQLGDKLQGLQTHEVVVLWDEENQEYGVQIIEFPELWFELGQFVSKWHDIKKTGNINQRSVKK